MYIRQIKYNFFNKYLLFVIGLVLVLQSHFSLFGLPKSSPWDYEHFSLLDFYISVLGIFLMLYGIYNFFKDDRIEFKEQSFVSRKAKVNVPYSEVHSVIITNRLSTISTSKGDFNIVNSTVSNSQVIERFMANELGFRIVNKKNWTSALFLPLFVITYMATLFLDNNVELKQNFVSKLPLKKIETAQIEGRLITHASVILRTKGNNTNHMTLVTLHGGLEEYPGVFFEYDNFDLENEIINIQSPSVEERHKELIDISGSLPDNVSYKILQGTKVRLKVRPEDLEQVQNYLRDSGKSGKQEKPYDSRRLISFYELAIGDEIIAQKRGLKL